MQHIASFVLAFYASGADEPAGAVIAYILIIQLEIMRRRGPQVSTLGLCILALIDVADHTWSLA